MKPSLELKKHNQEIVKLISKYGLSNPRVFGSVAAGTDHEGSDLDLLVDPSSTTSLFDMGGLYEDLAKLLDCPFQILCPGDISEHFRHEVLKKAIPIIK